MLVPKQVIQFINKTIRFRIDESMLDNASMELVVIEDRLAPYRRVKKPALRSILVDNGVIDIAILLRGREDRVKVAIEEIKQELTLPWKIIF